MEATTQHYDKSKNAQSMTTNIKKQTCTATFCFFNYASNITKKKKNINDAEKKNTCKTNKNYQFKIINEYHTIWIQNNNQSDT